VPWNRAPHYIADRLKAAQQLSRGVCDRFVVVGPAAAAVANHRHDTGGPPRGPPMSEVTRILSAIEQGEPHAAEQLLPLVYDELRKLAAQRLAQEKPGQTLQAMSVRLV